MHRAIFVALACAFVLLVVGAGASSASRAGTTLSIPFSAAYTAPQLDAYAGADWLSVQGDLKNDRYSTLTQITAANVGKLKPAWHIHLGNCTNGLVVTAPLTAAVTPTPGEQIGVPAQAAVCGGEEANAVVASGIMYLEDSQSSVYALDATNGNQLWKYTPAFAPGYNNGSGSRAPGVSLGQGLVFVSEPDGFVTALNQVNGAVIWKEVAGDWHKGVSLSDTPTYYNGEVIVGTSGGDGGGISSAMEAFNATTGQLMWAWNIIPNHNQPGGNTWPWSDKTGANFGGGAIWQNPSIDAKDGLVIIGTGNTVPWNSRGPGENLWTDTIVALNVNTGAFVWGYQTTHHDLWDSDLPNNTVQFDMTVKGKTVRAVADVTKQGFTWVLDAKTGKPLEPVTEVKVPQNTSPGVNTWPTQPIPQVPNTLPGCIGGDPTSGGGAVVCYDQPLKNGGGRICANSLRWTGLTAPDGKPYKVACYFEPYDTTQYVVTPFESMDWPASSYSPLTKSFITCGVTNRSFAFEQVPPASQIVAPAGGIGFGITAVIDSSIDPLNLNDFGNFSALDMGTVSPTSGGKFAWHQTWAAPCYSGSVNTAAGLTFVGHLGQGDAKNGLGYLAAVNTKTGQELWQSPLQDAPAAAAPITYSVNGVQYVTVVAGGENHNDPTRPNPAQPNQRVRGDSVYTYVLGG